MFRILQRKHLVMAVLGAALLFQTPQARAGGGFGSVWSKDSTADSITIDWTDPSDKYRSCGSSLKYRVCSKKAGAWVDTCRNYEKYTNSKPFTLSGLQDNSLYKLKVYTRAEKKNIWGNFRNCKFRKTGTVKIATQPKPTPLTYSLATVAADDRSLTVRVRFSQPSALDDINVCYKQKWWPYSLESECRTAIFESLVGKSFGYDNRTPPSQDYTVTFDGLLRCKSYKIVAYAWSSQQVFKIGETDGKTTGRCWVGAFKWDDVNVTEALVTDYDQVAQNYLAHVNEHYGHSCYGVFSHLRESYPQFAEGTGSIDPELLQEAHLLEYLAEEQPEVLAVWQKDLALESSGMNVTSWLPTGAPEVYEELRNEVDEPDPGECDWTPWLDRDNPSGMGDYETLNNFVAAGQACSSPEDIECRTLDGVDWREAGEEYSCRTDQGGVCVNQAQSDGMCEDYRVRFKCCGPLSP